MKIEETGAEEIVGGAAALEHAEPGAPEAAASLAHPFAEVKAEVTLADLRAGAVSARALSIASLQQIIDSLPATAGCQEMGAVRSDLEHAKGYMAAGR